LASETSGNGIQLNYEYDTYSRVKKEKHTAPDGKWLEKTYTYSGGNVYSIQYASQSGSIGTELQYIYQRPFERDKLGSTSIWKFNEENNFGQLTAVATGPVSQTYAYNSFGTPTGRTAGTFQNYSYSFDAAKGNLTYRKNNTRNRQEDFEYDNLNRLTAISRRKATSGRLSNIIHMH
jgi:hypothetical protein